MKNWKMKKTGINLDLMIRTLKINYDLANLLAKQDILTKNQAIKFLSPKEKFMYNTDLMKDIDKAIEIIKDAIENKNKILIYGDYDVDGVMSTVILYKTLAILGSNVDFYLPSRYTDGFGLNTNLINKFYSDGVNLIITCDNGIAALDEIALAKKLNMKIVVIDHHFPNVNENDFQDVLPLADAIIDNKQQKCNYPFKMLCAAGMAYEVYGNILSNNILNVKHKNNFYLKDDLLIFAMIGTLCDVVDLKEDNRIISTLGLDLLNKKKIKNKGLIELLKINNLYDKKISAEDISFIIGPCINACGRLETANLAIKLFLSEDDQEIKQTAKKIFDLNNKRKIMTRDACEEVFFDLENNYDPKNHPVIVYYNPNVEESIAGIIAGRIKEKYFHPVIFFTDSNEKEIIKGSARSIESYNIFEELQKFRDLFIKFGGHKLAAGMSMQKKNLDILDMKLNSNCKLNENDFIEEIEINDEIDFKKIDFAFLNKINLLAPFGHGNKKPLFISRKVKVRKINASSEKNFIIFELEQSKKLIKAIGFGLYNYFCEQLKIYFDSYMYTKILSGYLNDIDLFLDVVYSVEANEFNDKIYLQLRLKDFRLAGEF